MEMIWTASDGTGAASWAAMATVLVLMVVGGVLAFWFRRRWRRSRELGPDQGSGFGLQQLREMHQTGQITDKEYETLRVEVARRLGGN